MKIYDSPELLLKDSKACRFALVEALQQRCLSLFVGTGISKSASNIFPSWQELVEACCIASGTVVDKSRLSDNDYVLFSAERCKADCQRRGMDYRAVIEEALYSRVGPYSKNTMKTDLLIALGALIMNSVRGRSGVVVNYNYDDLLEWY